MSRSEPAVLADLADTFFAAGVDVVVWTMRGAIRPDRVEALAAALH